MNEKGLLAVRNAIVLKACKDYKHALIRKDGRSIGELENFFKGSYFGTLCPNIDGIAVMEEIRKQAREKKKDRRVEDMYGL